MSIRPHRTFRVPPFQAIRQHTKAAAEEYQYLVRNGTGRRKFKSGTEYEGQLVDGLPEGRGVMRWPDGSRYTGDFIQ